MAPDWTSSLGGRGLSVPGELVVLYRDGARVVKLMDPELPRHLTVLDPRSGEVVEQTVLDPLPEALENPLGDPRVYVFTTRAIALDRDPPGMTAPHRAAEQLRTYCDPHHTHPAQEDPMARRRALVTAAFAAVTALVVSAAPAEAAAPSYVALGDSYSSGTGTRSYLADGTSCLRSVYAYPSLIASAKGYALNFRACSGAKIPDVSSTQLSALTSSTAYVTISIGGNDAGFADVLTTCAQPAWLSNCTGCRRPGPVVHPQHPARGPEHPLREHPGPRPAGQGDGRGLPADLQR